MKRPDEAWGKGEQAGVDRGAKAREGTLRPNPKPWNQPGKERPNQGVWAESRPPASGQARRAEGVAPMSPRRLPSASVAR